MSLFHKGLRKNLHKIGITGGIGSGKTKLLTYLSTIPRIYTINLDLYGHEVYKLNPIVLRNLKQIYGQDVLKYDREGHIEEVNRETLGRIVFQSPYSLHKLVTLTGPEIKRLLKETINEVETKLHS